MLIVHKIAIRIRIRIGAALGHGKAIVPGYSATCTPRLLSRFFFHSFASEDICTIVSNPEGGAHDADAHAEVARGANLDFVLSKKDRKEGSARMA